MRRQAPPWDVKRKRAQKQKQGGRGWGKRGKENGSKGKKGLALGGEFGSREIS